MPVPHLFRGDAFKLTAYVVSVILLGALLAPQLHALGNWALERGFFDSGPLESVKDSMERAQLTRYFNRAVMIAALALAWPFIRWIGIERGGNWLPKHRPASATGKVLAYAVRHWEKFERYLEDGRFEWERSGHSQPQAARRASVARQIDNNLVENGMRPMKLGMKNWLFFGAEGAGHHAAAIYTLVENCKALDLPVESYLKELLTVLPGVSDPALIASLTPARVALARRSQNARRCAA